MAAGVLPTWGERLEPVCSRFPGKRQGEEKVVYPINPDVVWDLIWFKHRRVHHERSVSAGVHGDARA